MKHDLLKRFTLIAALVIVIGTSDSHFNVALPIVRKQESTLSWLRGAQQSKIALPSVKAAQVPLYPPIARYANIQGVVCLEVTTDGYKVTSVAAKKNSHPVLARAAEANLRTWEFSFHEPTTFTVTYHYKLVDDLEPLQNNPRVTLKLPTEVEVDALRWTGTVDMPAKIK